MGERGLSERKKLILKAIIDAHIAYGEPVGSKFLANDKQLACSSATIRNEMAELEALGYLEQPHTSAGRVPSEQGYRFYVDSLLDDYSRTRYEIEKINLSRSTKSYTNYFNHVSSLFALGHFPSIILKAVCSFQL